MVVLMDHTCPYCGGSGRVGFETACDVCGGTGVVRMPGGVLPKQEEPVKWEGHKHTKVGWYDAFLKWFLSTRGHVPEALDPVSQAAECAFHAGWISSRGGAA